MYTVSQIARRTGLTVRTLHHYEAKGLLQPAGRSAAGYRLYGVRELARLQHVASLKSLGFSLDEIRSCLASDTPAFADVLVRHVDRLRAAVARQHDLLMRMERIAEQAARGEAIDAETLLDSIEATTLMDNYLNPEQMNYVKARAAELGPARIRAVEEAWPDVIAGMQAALQLGKDPASAEVAALASRWRALLREFTGGDAGVQASLNTMFKAEPEAMRARTGIDPALMAYACTAIAALPE